ncbi:hypothetical protein RKD29_007509 [Streptomyces tendae]|uniref:hypothetical protein n=1 Tax=Streptomyces tendae TaxID=1932 RepID=UPI00383399FE
MGCGPEEADGARGTVATDAALGFGPVPLLWAPHDAGSQAVVLGRPKDHRRADELVHPPRTRPHWG